MFEQFARVVEVSRVETESFERWRDVAPFVARPAVRKSVVIAHHEIEQPRTVLGEVCRAHSLGVKSIRPPGKERSCRAIAGWRPPSLGRLVRTLARRYRRVGAQPGKTALEK